MSIVEINVVKILSKIARLYNDASFDPLSKMTSMSDRNIIKLEQSSKFDYCIGGSFKRQSSMVRC